MINDGTVQVYEGMGLLQAWRVISPTQIKAIVDTVRTRILDLALSLEKIAPKAGDPDAEQPEQAQLQPIVTNVYGGTPNIAVASAEFAQSVSLPAVGDERALIAYLRDLGIGEDELGELTEALEDDRANGDAGMSGMGPSVGAWLGRLMVRGGAIAGTAAAGTVGTMAARAVASYFGLPTP
jgi:hypothetical protein